MPMQMPRKSRTRCPTQIQTDIEAIGIDGGFKGFQHSPKHQLPVEQFCFTQFFELAFMGFGANE